MASWIWWYAALHPAVRMVKGSSPLVLGLTARDVLGRYASQCTITEFAWPFSIPAAEREKFPWPPEELIIGSVIEQYHAAFDALTAGDKEAPRVEDLVATGVRAAARQHLQDLRELGGAAEKVVALIDSQLAAKTNAS
jgi:hypothetical protein